MRRLRIRKNRRWYQVIATTVIVIWIIVGSVVWFYQRPNLVHASSVGPRTATSSGDCISTGSSPTQGTVAWTNPGNAAANDTTNLATAGLAKSVTSNWLECTNFGFTTAMIPTGSTINGIVVGVGRSASTSNSTTTDAAVRLIKGGTVGTTDRATATAWPTSLTNEDHGTSTDLWGTTWMVSDVTASNFGVALSAVHGGTGNATYTFSVDYLQVTVYYAPPWSTINQRQGVITDDQNNTVLSSHTAKIGERFRVIDQIDTGAGLSRNIVFKLQYDKNDNSWHDVTPSSVIRAVKSSIVKLPPKLGTGLAGTCTGGTTKQSGYVVNGQSVTPALAVNGSTCMDIGFIVDTLNAAANTTYRFRLSDVTDATAFSSYVAYPSVTTVTSTSNTTRASASNTTSLASAQSDLAKLLDDNGYSNINTNDTAREMLQNVTSDTTVDITATGETTSNLFGVSVASAGDVNGDGYVDVIVGAKGYTASEGRAYIFYGGASMDSTADVTMTGEGASNNFGVSVASAGDINGDGYADVIVGAKGYSSSTGRAYIFYGGPSIDTTVDVTLTGGATFNNFGSSVASAGDVNGDGYADVIVGASAYATNTGRAYIFYGGTSMDTTADVILTGEATSNNFGSSVASAGDVNGDGYADVIVGAYGYSSSTGRAYIFFGGSSMDATADITITGAAANDQLGYSVASAGDVNGDGYADVIVGANGYSGGAGTGRAYIFYGGASMDNTADVTLTGEATGNSFGTSVSSAGDVNGDGYADVIVGASGYSTSTGRAYVFYGGPGMSSSIAASSANIILIGEATNNSFGSSVASLGDVTGDGYPEIIVGAKGNTSNTGKSYVYLGGGTNYTPVFNLAQKSSSACSGITSISASWIGQSNVAAGTNNLLLQVYRFGSTNAWQTVTTNSSQAANSDGTITGSVSTSMSEYCDGSNWSYWRLYQASGQQNLQTNQFSLTFSGGSTGPTNDQLMRHGSWFNNGIRMPFTF